MRLLLDTHAFLWYMAGADELSGLARELIDDRANERLLSAAVPWEMAIKYSLGKLEIAEPFESLIPRLIEQNGMSLLGVTLEHTSAVATLPYPVEKHRDPFDRLMIAQSKVEGIPIVSVDSRFDDYEVERLW